MKRLAKRLSGSGLTGIHLNFYGIDNGENLLKLILKTMEVPGIRRATPGFPGTRIITEKVVNALNRKNYALACLSLQSGCDATQTVNRRYTTEEYYEKCVLLREKFDHRLDDRCYYRLPSKKQKKEFAETETFSKDRFSMRHIFSNIPNEKGRKQMPWNIRSEEIRQTTAISC